MSQDEAELKRIALHIARYDPKQALLLAKAGKRKQIKEAYRRVEEQVRKPLL